MKKGIWSTSKLVAPKRVDPIVPWMKLTKLQKNSFTSAFLSEDAIYNRTCCLKPFRQDHHDIHLAALIRLYREAVTLSISDTDVLEQCLKDFIFHLFLNGEWEKLSWLVGYSKSFYFNGYLGSETKITELDPMNQKDDSSMTLKHFMLREFSRLSGIPMIALVCPVAFVDNETELPKLCRNIASVIMRGSDASAAQRAMILPKGLPTKNDLDSATIKQWRIFSGSQSVESAESSLSRMRKSLGLDKLPKKAPTKRA